LAGALNLNKTVFWFHLGGFHKIEKKLLVSTPKSCGQSSQNVFGELREREIALKFTFRAVVREIF
jgi:hypothetical protein